MKENEQLTSEEMDAMWSFLYRNQTAWHQYIQNLWHYKKDRSVSLCCSALNKLMNLIDHPNENHNRP